MVTNVTSDWVDGNFVFGEKVDGTYVRFKTGIKVHRRPTDQAFAAEIKSEFADTDAAHACVAVTADWKPTAAGVAAPGTAGGVQGVQGVARLKSSSYTATGGTLIGTYGQVQANGTVNGAGIMLAGLYGLVEAGGTYTAVSHVAGAWIDSHLASAVSAGSYQLLYMTNNGTTQMDQAIYIYGGDKTTALMELDTCGGMVGANTAAKTTIAGTNWVPIKITIDGVVHYMLAAQTLGAA